MTRRTLALCFAPAVATIVACSGAGGTGTSGSASGGGTTATTTGTSGTTTTGSGTSSGSGGGSTSGSMATDGGADTWTNWASQDFFQTYCVSCHRPGGEGNPGDAGLDFNFYANVSKNIFTIRCGAAAAQDPSWNCTVPVKQFPIGTGPHPADADRDRLVAWIDAGYPE